MITNERNISGKVYPTVAISDEFMEQQRRVERKKRQGK